MRDYGTGAWEGGDEGCDHAKPTTTYNEGFNERWGQGAGERKQEKKSEGQYAQTCGKCGARRVDQQLGLEPTPDQYVQQMVEVFREVRRVLAEHGTCWVNLGDSYVGSRVNDGTANPGISLDFTRAQISGTTRPNSVVVGLKPKDLVGIPWRVAFALQQDGWYLRADIIWSKSNPMPESVTDRPTKAHEYVFLLTKQPRYWFDAEAVREPHTEPGRAAFGITPRAPEQIAGNGPDGRRGTLNSMDRAGAQRIYNPAGRNVRSVWTIATQPYPEAHFATYPEELVRRCVLAGCAPRVCRVCAKPSERIVSVESVDRPDLPRDHPEWRPSRYDEGKAGDPQSPGPGQRFSRTETLGWSECGCLLTEGENGAASSAHRPETAQAAPSVSKWRPGVVLDPFVGSGTTCKVARDHGRHSVGIDLSADYLELAAKRLAQQSLLSEPAA